MKLKSKIFPCVAAAACIMSACSSVNCPLDNYVACKFVFYDLKGTQGTLNDILTVSTLKPGNKTVYRYEKLGYTSFTRDTIDQALVDSVGYTVRKIVNRNDTVLNQLQYPSEFTLPVSFYNVCDTFVLSYATISNVDTVYLFHDNYTRVENPECGCYQFHNIGNLRFTTNRFKSMLVSNPRIDYLKEENIRIYMYEDEEEEE